jgi:hypothetical protein
MQIRPGSQQRAELQIFLLFDVRQLQDNLHFENYHLSLRLPLQQEGHKTSQGYFEELALYFLGFFIFLGFRITRPRTHFQLKSYSQF